MSHIDQLYDVFSFTQNAKLIALLCLKVSHHTTDELR